MTRRLKRQKDPNEKKIHVIKKPPNDKKIRVEERPKLQEDQSDKKTHAT